MVRTDYCAAQDVIPHRLIPGEVKESVFQRKVLLPNLTAVELVVDNDLAFTNHELHAKVWSLQNHDIITDLRNEERTKMGVTQSCVDNQSHFQEKCRFYLLIHVSSGRLEAALQQNLPS